MTNDALKAEDWQRMTEKVQEAAQLLKQREGDQALPTVNDGPCIQDLVTQDIAARTAVGISRYGTCLQPNNGRDSLRDAYEEALDLTNYLRQLLFERDGS